MNATTPSFDYAAARRNFKLEIPNNFNFAFDVVAKRGREADKTALIAIDKTGEHVIKHSYSDLEQNSNRFAHVLMELGAAKGDFAFVMVPRLAVWYHVLLGCMKTGVVAMPGTMRSGLHLPSAAAGSTPCLTPRGRN